MQIKRVTLQNFGRHASLDFDMGAPVVGVLGENGSGKSTLLEAIRYCFTGTLRDNANTYMRDDGKHGAAVVEMEFVKDGVPGKITRRITKTTSSRTLTWGDAAPITSVKEVDAAMRDILNADKRSVVGCVFVRQGELDKVLFGDKAERERNFLRMVGCAHLELVAKTAAQQAAILRADSKDNGPLMLELATQLEERASRFRDLTRELDGLPDQSVLLASLLQHRQALLAITQQEAVKEAAERALKELIATAQTPEAFLASLRSDAETIGVQVTNCNMLLTQYRDSLTGLEALEGNYWSMLRAHQALEAAAAEVSKAPPDQTQELEKRRADYQIAFHKTMASKTLLEHTINFHTWTERSKLKVLELDSFQNDLQEADSKVAAVERAASILREDPKIGLLRLQVNLLEPLSTGKHDLQACPLCRSSTAHLDPAAITGMLKSAKEEISRYTAELQELEARVLQTKKASQTAAGKVIRVQNEAQVFEAQLKGLPEVIFLTKEAQQAETDQLVAELAALEQTGKQLSANQTLRQSALDAHTRAHGAFETWRQRPDYVQIANFIPAQAADMRRTLVENTTHAQQEVAQLQTQLTTLQRSIANLESAITTAGRANVSLAQARQHIQNAMSLQDTEQQIATLTSAQQAREQRMAVYQEVQQDIRNLQAKQADLEIQQQAFTKKLAKADEMDVLVQTFGKDGIASRYLDALYGNLMQVVIPHLSHMGANFTVRKGEGPLSFEFQRLDEPSEWMDQVKLSGGQRVKMDIAFLLALQQVIIPDVGLLVLDEPTTHLDEESREGFRDTLEQLQGLLQRTECQVIVCDHCREILPALQRVVRLTGGEVKNS